MDKKKILVIDDEPSLVDMLKVRLEANGYSVISAYDGKEGMEKTKKERPDLVLLDILMPEMDGYTYLKELKNTEGIKDIPVIMLTAKVGMKDLFEVEGITDYIVKPFDDDDLLLRIKRGLMGR